MQCPNCQFDHREQTTECLKCGIVFAKYARRQEALENGLVHPDGEVLESGAQLESKEEIRYRLLALPTSLAVACLLVGSVLASFIRTFLSMWVHESGHAVTAWLCGFGAFPGPWRTPVSGERITLVSVALAGGLGWGVFQAWRGQRWPLVAGGATLLGLQLICTFMPAAQANALIIFGGDAGCMVLGSLLMATFYARRESDLYRGALRWGFLVIGATAFMDAFRTWWGAWYDMDRIPFGEIEGVGLSDPSRLTEDFGWAVQTMIDRYVWLGVACLCALAVLYVIGIMQARAEVNAMARTSQEGSNRKR